MELNTADNNSRVIYSIAYKITKYYYSFIFTFLVKETAQANQEYDIFGSFWVRFGKFTDPHHILIRVNTNAVVDLEIMCILK